MTARTTVKIDRRLSGIKVSCLILGIFSLSSLANAQRFQEPGKSIGTISTQGNLIVMTLNEDALGKANLFDLAHHTLRFTPDGAGYRAENLPLQWDPECVPARAGSEASLKNSAFPFSSKTGNPFTVGMTASIAFGEPEPAENRGR